MEIPLITDGAQLEEWWHADPDTTSRTIRADVYDQSLICRRWPGNNVTVASLKETLPKTINRWWQTGRQDDEAVCPIKTKPQTVLRNMFLHHAHHAQVQEADRNKEQTVLTTVAASGVEIQLHPSFFAHEGNNHFLVLPKECWSRATTQMAGGVGALGGVIKLARETMGAKWNGSGEFSLQVGIHAAQNLVHAHFHVYRNLGGLANFGAERITLYKSIVSPSLHIAEENGLIITAGGLRTGQVLFLPVETEARPEFDGGFATQLFGVTDVYTRKLMSVQNNPVDFAFEVSVREGKVAFGAAYPVVGPLGTMEFLAPLMSEAKYWNIGWPEEETCKLWAN